MSLAGTLRPGLSMVAGNVLLDPRISGELVDTGAIGPRPIGNISNRLVAPPHEMIDLGARYRFKVASARALLRLQAANVLDDYGWQVSANGAFQYSTGRRFLAELRVDI